MYKQFKKKKQTLFFKRWARKTFSVFKSINQQVVIVSMILAVSLPFTTKTIEAQTKSDDPKVIHDIDELVVTGEAIAVPFSQSARIVTVISKDQIESLPVNDINDLLEYALNVDVRQRGVFGVQADLSIRGGSFDQTLILLNGINISDPQTGHLQLNLPVDLSSVSKIEILNGPAARAYGVNAMSGVVNIITNQAENNKATLSLLGGENGLLRGNVSINAKTGKFNHFFSSNYKKSDGYLSDKTLNNTDFNNTNLFYHLNTNFKSNTFDFQIGYNTKEFGSNSFYTPKYPNQFEATKTKFTSLTYKYGTNSLKIKPSIYYKRSHDRFELFRDNPASWYQHHNYHMTDVWGTNLSATYLSDYGNINFGLQYRDEHIYSNVLGETMEDTMDVPGEDKAVFTKEKSRYTVSSNMEYSLNLNHWHVAVGLMGNKYSMIDKIKLFPSAEINYNIYRGLRLFASYNEALRLPTFTDLYYNGPTNVGNPNLEPEESKTYEGGLKYVGKAIRIQGAYFYRKSDNIIDWVKNSNEEKWQTKNLTNINASGVDFSFDILPLMYDADFFITNIKFSYAFTHLDKDSKGFISKYALDYLKDKVGINLTHKIYHNLTAGWGFTYQNREGGYLVYENNEFGDFTDYEPFTLLDIKLMYQYKNWKFHVSANNIFDKTYYDYGNIPQPERWISGGACFKIDW